MLIGTGCIRNTPNAILQLDRGEENVASLVIRNFSAVALCYVHFAPVGAGSRGPDRLGVSEVVMPYSARDFALREGTYLLEFEDCSHRLLFSRDSLEVRGSGVEVLFHHEE